MAGLRDILNRASVTQPATQPSSGEVKPIRSWDDLHSDITRANNELVRAQGDEHRTKIDHEEAVEAVTEAKAKLSKAREAWAERTRTVLGIDLSKVKDVEEQVEVVRDTLQSRARQGCDEGSRRIARRGTAQGQDESS